MVTSEGRIDSSDQSVRGNTFTMYFCTEKERDYTFIASNSANTISEHSCSPGNLMQSRS